jgi:hypothetical protein
MLEGYGGNSSALAVQIAVAVSLLMLGRRLYWLFVAGVGFVVVMDLAREYLDLGEGWATLALAIGAGIIGGLLAVFLQKLAVAIAGFAAAAYVAGVIADGIGQSGQTVSVVILVVGVLGAVFASFLFDGALILMSSLAGAVLLVDAFDLRDQAALAVMAIVAVAGIVIQSNMLHRDGATERKGARR